MSLFDEIITETEREPFKQIPQGFYRVRVRDAQRVKSQGGTDGIRLNFDILQALEVEGDDVPDDNRLGRARLSDTLWISEATLNSKYPPKDKLAAINPDVVGMSYAESISVLPGSEVVVRLKHVTVDRNGETLRIPRLEVVAYYEQESFFQRRMKNAA